MKKRNKALLITAILFAITAVAFLIVGFSLAGTNVIEWLFTSQYAWLFFIVFGTYGLVILFIILGDKIKRL